MRNPAEEVALAEFMSEKRELKRETGQHGNLKLFP